MAAFIQNEPSLTGAFAPSFGDLKIARGVHRGTGRNDTLRGGGGGDTYRLTGTPAGGAANRDVIVDRGGRDVLDYTNRQFLADEISTVGRSGNDLVINIANGGRITVRNHWGVGTLEVLRIRGFSYQVQTGTTGGAGADMLIASRGRTHLVGGDGDDVLAGSRGRDILEGGAGDDYYMVDTPSDRVIETANGGDDDTVQASCSYRLPDYVESLQGIGRANQTLVGNGADNYIAGGGGRDILYGGGGRDEFAFEMPGEGTDRIRDFRSGTDRLVFVVDGYTALDTGLLSADQFESNTTGAATRGDTRLVFNTRNRTLYYDGNGAAAGGRMAVAQLNVRSLSNTDILVIAD